MLFKRKLKEDPLSMLNAVGGGMDEVLLKAFKKAAEELLTSGELVDMIARRAVSYIRIPKDGEDAQKPIAGVDYPIPKDGETPIKGRDYFTEQEVKTFIDKVANRFKQPDDGRTPVRGRDYFTESDQKDFQENLNAEDVVKKINNLPLDEDKKIDASHIKNLPKSVGGKETALFRGGLKLLWNTTLDGTVNGINKVFTVPATLPDPKDDRFIVSVRGVLKTADAGDFVASSGNRTITFTNAPPNGSDSPRIIIYHGK